MLSDPRFIIGAILAAAVLAVSSFALYAMFKVMQQAKAGVVESSRTPPFAAGEDWHRYQSVGPNPGPGDKAVPPGAVSILLNALPKTTQSSPEPSRSHGPPAAAEPLEAGDPFATLRVFLQTFNLSPWIAGLSHRLPSCTFARFRVQPLRRDG
jgi:hypothetical protein